MRLNWALLAPSGLAAAAVVAAIVLAAEAHGRKRQREARPS